jgi:hypothetical protein
MTPEIRRLLERQAAWQRTRMAKPWAERLRMSVVLRKTLEAIRKRPTERPENS